MRSLIATHVTTVSVLVEVPDDASHEQIEEATSDAIVNCSEVAHWSKAFDVETGESLIEDCWTWNAAEEMVAVRILSDRQPRLRAADGRLLGEELGEGMIIYAGSDWENIVDPPRDWGPWTLDPDIFVLWPSYPYRYEVDLERELTPEILTGTIGHISRKTWADDALMAGLIRAFDDIFRLYAGGMTTKWSAAKVRRRVAVVAAERAHSLAVYADDLVTA